MTKRHQHAETDSSVGAAPPSNEGVASQGGGDGASLGGAGVGTQGTPPPANLEAQQGATQVGSDGKATGGSTEADLDAVKRAAAAGEPLIDLAKTPADRETEQAAHELKGKGEGNPRNSETAIPRTYRAYVPDDQIKARAIGSPVYYRSGAPHQDGHSGTTLHAALITDLHDDWSADLTVFPKRAGMYHIECAPLHRGSGWDPSEISMGCYRPRE